MWRKRAGNGECKSIEITKGQPDDMISHYPMSGQTLESFPVDPTQFQQLPPDNGIAPAQGTSQQQAPPVAPMDIMHGAQRNDNYNYFRR